METTDYKTGPLGFETDLFKAADKLRGSMESSDYKHVVLGLIFLKHISDRFENKRTEILERRGKAAAEDRDRYLAVNIFWVHKNALWPHLQAHAKQPGVRKLIDDDMIAIEEENPGLKGDLPTDYSR